jgi:serine/threonine-protein kinase
MRRHEALAAAAPAADPLRSRNLTEFVTGSTPISSGVNLFLKHALVLGVKAGGEGQDEVGLESESSSAPGDASLDSPEPAVGSYIDARYRVAGVLGRGGMAVVYAGEHMELQRAVAIKVLDRVQASNPGAVEQFLLEARTASALSHPHIVSVSDLGRLPDGRPYLVMPLIVGTDVADLLMRQGPIAPWRAATLLRGVAAALDSIHAKGLLHRDIKCENLMHVVNEDGTESLLVLDFGIASASLSRMSQEPGTWSGTPEYMPPEAFSGAPPDRRADVYALAAVAFELIAGRLPFDGGDLGDLIAAKSQGSAHTLSEASGVEFDARLEAVIARGLAALPEERYDSAGALVDALAAVCAVAPEQAQRRAPAIERSRRGRTLARTGHGAAQAAWYGEDVYSMETQPIQAVRERSPLESETRPITTRVEASRAALPDDPWLHKWSLPKMAPAQSAPEQPTSSKPPPADTRVHTSRPPISVRAPRTSSSPPMTASDVRRLFDYAALIGVVVIAFGLNAHWDTVQKWIIGLLLSVDEAPGSALSLPEPVGLPLPNVLAGAADESSDPSDTRRAVRAVRMTRDGLRALSTGDFTSSLDAFEGATALDSRYAPAWHGKGLALDRMGNVREAADAYREFLKLQKSGDDAEKVRKRLWQLSPR